VATALFYAFQRSERLKQLVTRQKQDLQVQRDQLDSALQELRTTQAQLIQHEKLASLGELTAGIAHEMQNPLNFVINFADLSVELVEELAEQQLQLARDADLEGELLGELKQNLLRITGHGQQAARIVRSMPAPARGRGKPRT
jgi:C4-dicarboxylate-specific signal transduction histidine kinase